MILLTDATFSSYIFFKISNEGIGVPIESICRWKANSKPQTFHLFFSLWCSPWCLIYALLLTRATEAVSLVCLLWLCCHYYQSVIGFLFYQKEKLLVFLAWWHWNNQSYILPPPTWKKDPQGKNSLTKNPIGKQFLKELWSQ